MQEFLTNLNKKQKIIIISIIGILMIIVFIFLYKYFYSNDSEEILLNQEGNELQNTTNDEKENNNISANVRK